MEPDPAAPVVVELPAQPKKTPHPEEPWAFDVQHYDIHVALDFQRRSLTGRVRITLRDLEDGVPALRLDAAGMTITDVSTLGPESRFTPSTWGIEGDELLVTLPGGSRAGSERQVEVRWQCTPRRGVHFTAPPPGAPEWGRQVWTQGECEDTRWWLPCHDAPNDRATHAIHVTVPDGMTVTAAGRREGVEDTPGPTSTWSFAMDVPHVSYLTTFVAGDLLIGDDSAGPVPLEIVSNARDAAHAATSLGRTTDVLRFFAEYTGRAYPYPRYAQCCVRDFIFGGMENISATTLTDTTVHPPEWGPVKSSDGLVAHEAAHQWFGDLVTCRHWSHIWLNEGFATYFTLLWKEHDEGRDAFLTAVRGTMNGALGACEKARRPVVSDVYAQPFDLFFDGHAYGGGAARLHALRQRLGDATFRDAVRRYVAAQAESVVTTEDFERAVSEAAGEDMRWWFDQWLRSPGRPKLRVRWKWDAEAGALRVTTAQTQDEKGFPQVYRLLLDVACDLRNGRTLSERLDVSTREQEFLIPLPSEPRLVRLDPGRGLLARLDVERGPAEWRALADGDPSPAGRIDALDALVRIARDGKAEKFARERSRDGLLAGLRDPRHDVRRAAVGHLRKIRNVASRDALLGVAANDADPRVRQTAVDALPEWLGDPGVVAALETAYAGDASVHVRAAALRGLARLAAPGVWDRLTEALESTTWQSHLRAAALGSFADLGDERAFPLLVAAAAPGADPWTRDEALAALGRMGRARPDYTEAVLAHLHDPRLAIREAAARALGELRDAGALPALLDAHATEHWPGTLRHLRGAIEKCVKARAEPAPQPAPEPAPQPAPAK